MSEQKTVKSKEVVINHYKLGNVKLGKIPNNEKCRMIVQLIQEKQQLTNTIMLTDAMFGKMSQRVLNTAKEKVKKDIDERKKKLAKNTTNTK